jgi:hypothetical protein
MSLNSRLFSIGWRKPAELPKVKTRTDVHTDWASEIEETGIPSIPGRTARLKAVNLLQIAAEVEHALMAQYLYAAYSLDEAFEQGDGETTRVVDRWKRDIRTIARQEMAHFITVQNLLIALGAEVYVNRENNFSEHPDQYPFPVKMEPFALDTLARYVATESPIIDEIADQTTRDLVRKILRRADRSDMEVKTKVNRVGLLYTALYWLFLKSDSAQGPWRMPNALRGCMHDSLKDVHLKDSDFVPIREYEQFCADSGEWEAFEDSFHVGQADPRLRALRAIRWIMIQGEGPAGAACNDTESHFCRFLRIYQELERDARLARAARPVPVNPVVPDTARTEPIAQGAQAITHPESKLWANLFNVRYQMLLLDILLALSTNRQGPDGNLRKQLTSWAASHEMEYLKQIGQLLPTLPRALGSKGRAGAPFEIVMLPTDSTKRWDQQRVLIEGSNELVKRLKKMIFPHDLRFSLLQSILEFDRGRRNCVETQSSVVRRNYGWRNGTNQRIAKRG